MVIEKILLVEDNPSYLKSALDVLPSEGLVVARKEAIIENGLELIAEKICNNYTDFFLFSRGIYQS